MKSSSNQGNSKLCRSMPSTSAMSRRIIQRMWTRTCCLGSGLIAASFRVGLSETQIRLWRAPAHHRQPQGFPDDEPATERSPSGLPHPSDPVFWPWLAMLGIAGGSLLATSKRRDWVEVVILLLVVWQSAMHLRHVAFVSLLCGYWIAPHFQSAMGRLLPAESARRAESLHSVPG